ncbi:MAG: nicotinate (nicotinamide) nucleotide adenylyltransferase [Chlamydiales bacterium]|nr:nicotinate (nicotinamide) nucleotide adenylyltransferase [Chlamydiales bacterium]
MTGNRRIGLFGGTFDPIHFGHLNIALQLKDLAQLDKVLFCPTAISPFKMEQSPIASDIHRLKMCELALEGIEGCSVLDLEIKRQGVSYTIDTVKELGSGVYLMLAEDALPRLHLWKDAEALLRLAPPIIGSRHPNTQGYNPKLFSPDIQQLIENGRYQTRVMEISSTAIRQQLLAGGYYLGHMVPRKVLDYIHKHRLYSKEQYEERPTIDTKPSCANLI